MSELATLDNMPDSYKRLLAKLQPEDNLTGGASKSTSRRLSIRGGVFRKVVNGKEVGELESRTLKAVSVKAAPVSRMFYKGQYVAGESNPPTCWSSDINTHLPSVDVIASDRQANDCNECEQNIKGSGQGDSKACRFQQRIAILLADADGNITSNHLYALSLPATSIFGNFTSQDKMSMRAYAQHLAENGAAASSLLTELRFDTDSSTPKLRFKALRPLEEKELMVVIEAQISEEAERMVTLSVAPPKENALDAPKAVAKVPLFADNNSPVEKETAEENVEETAEDDEEPTLKVTKKKAEAPKGDEDISGLLDEWDD